MLHLCVIKAGASPTEQHDISLATLPPAPLQSRFPISVSYFWGVHIDISLTKLYLNFFLSQAPSEYANQLTAWRTFSLVRSLFCCKESARGVLGFPDAQSKSNQDGSWDCKIEALLLFYGSHGSKLQLCSSSHQFDLFFFPTDAPGCSFAGASFSNLRNG